MSVVWLTKFQLKFNMHLIANSNLIKQIYGNHFSHFKLKSKIKSKVEIEFQIVYGVCVDVGVGVSGGGGGSSCRLSHLLCGLSWFLSSRFVCVCSKRSVRNFKALRLSDGMHGKVGRRKF